MSKPRRRIHTIFNTCHKLNTKKIKNLENKIKELENAIKYLPMVSQEYKNAESDFKMIEKI